MAGIWNPSIKFRTSHSTKIMTSHSTKIMTSHSTKIMTSHSTKIMTSHSTNLMTSEHKQINPVRSKTPMVSADSQSNRTSNGAGTPLKPYTSLQPQYHSKAGYGARRGRQVFVGLSGGVDSSVSAALLKRLHQTISQNCLVARPRRGLGAMMLREYF